MKKQKSLALIVLVLVMAFCGFRWQQARRPLLVVPAPAANRGFSIQFTPDGSAIACGSTDGVVRFYETKPRSWWHSRRVIKTLSGHSGAIELVDFSPDGTLLAGANSEGQISIWKLADSKLLRAFPTMKSTSEDALISVAWFPDNKTLAVSINANRHSDTGSRMELWDIQSGQKQRVIKSKGRNISASADGTMYAVEGIWTYKNGRMDTTYGELRRVSDEKLIRQLKDLGHDMESYFLRFSPDGKSLLAFGSQKKAMLYDVATGKLRREFKAGYDMTYPMTAFSTDSQWVATGGSNCCWVFGNAVSIHSVQGAVIDRDIIPADSSSVFVSGLSFSPDGSLLAVSRSGVGVELFKVK
jgi:WD40 repeat protein